MGRVRDDFESVNMRVHSMVNDIRTAKEMGADLCDPMAQVEMKLSEGFELLQVIPDRAGPPFASTLGMFFAPQNYRISDLFVCAQVVDQQAEELASTIAFCESHLEFHARSRR